MRAAVLASIGDPGSIVADPSSPILRAPASDRLCDAVVVGFALWTVCCHAVVAAGRGVVTLLVLYAAVLIAYLLLSRRFGTLAALPSPTSTAELAAAADPTPWNFRFAALVAGIAAALSVRGPADITHLWWSAVILLWLAAAVVCFGAAPRIAPPEGGRRSEWLLWLLAAAAVVLTLISHRPDADDAFYVSVAVATADIPGWPLLSADTMHGIAGLPLYLPVYRVHSYELLNGAVAYLTGIPAIYSFHWLSAAFAALLVPLAHARLFRILTPRRWLAAVATLMLVLVAVGETHRWYGNFAFVRLWQGKSISLLVFIPLVYAYALRFGLRRQRRDWAMLLAAQIGAVGCSSSGLWLAPTSAALALCCAVRPSRRGVETVILGVLSSLYVLGAAWLVRGNLEGAWNTAIAKGASSAPDLYWAFANMLGEARLLSFALAAMLTGWVFAPAGLARRFAVVVPLGVLLALLNPYVANWVALNVTGPSYWRSMWALPLPIVMALMLTSPLHLGDAWSGQGVRRAAWLGLLAAFAVFIPRQSGLSRGNGVELGWPRLKVPEAEYRWAVAVNESVPPGSHVAVPSDIATWIVTLHHHSYPLVVRHYLHTWGTRLTHEELLDRMAMQRFLDSPELVEATPEQFRNGLERFEVQAVCLTSSPRAEAARGVIQQAGFRLMLSEPDYELWVRGASRSGARRQRKHR